MNLFPKINPWPYKPTFHKDGTVSYFAYDCYSWVRIPAIEICPGTCCFYNKDRTRLEREIRKQREVLKLECEKWYRILIKGQKSLAKAWLKK